MTGPTDAQNGAKDAANAGTPDGGLEHFAARVAHDFNNLLTGILGNLELLQHRAARNNISGLDSYLNGANSAGTRAVEFATRLMAFSGHDSAPPERVALDALLGEFASLAACRLAAPGAVLFCDPAQLELAMTELLDNAEAAGGQVFIHSAMAEGQAIVTVRDTGQGMTPEILEHAMEPFFTTAANGTGKGLGLAIVARVMRDLRGGMSIEAQEGAGCTVTLRLPCV